MTALLGVTLLISGVGIGFGSALALTGGAKDVETTAEQPKPTKVAGIITRDLVEKCKLDQQQADQVREIMAKRLKTLHEIRVKAMDEMVAIHRKINEDMRGVMSSDQFKRWEKHNEEARRRSRFRHHNWKHGPQRGGDRGGRGGPDMFKRLDKDNDGKLSENEVFGSPEQKHKFMKEADKNGDGKVDRKEFESHIRRRWQMGPGRMRKPHGRPSSRPSSKPAPDLSMFFWI